MGHRAQEAVLAPTCLHASPRAGALHGSAGFPPRVGSCAARLFLDPGDAA